MSEPANGLRYQLADRESRVAAREMGGGENFFRPTETKGTLKAVQKLLGHASIQTTADIYTDWDIDQLAETMREVLKGEET